MGAYSNKYDNNFSEAHAVIFLARCDLIGFLYPREFPLPEKSLKSQQIRKITTQKARKSIVNKVECVVLKIPANIFLLGNFT